MYDERRFVCAFWVWEGSIAKERGAKAFLVLAECRKPGGRPGESS